jgi:hypothetical protein
VRRSGNDPPASRPSARSRASADGRAVVVGIADRPDVGIGNHTEVSDEPIDRQGASNRRPVTAADRVRARGGSSAPDNHGRCTIVLQISVRLLTSIRTRRSALVDLPPAPSTILQRKRLATGRSGLQEPS